MRIPALLVGAGIVTCAQEAPPKTQTGAVVANVISVGVTLEVVTGAPYSAEQVSSRLRVLSDGTRIEQPPTSSTRLYRDGLGRIREEIIAFAASGARTVSMVMISDPVGEFHYTLDPKNKTAHRVKVKVRRPDAGEKRRPMGPSGPNTAREPLGVQFINGIEAQGELVRLTMPAGLAGNDRPIVETTEIWTSIDLQTTLRQVIRSPLRGEATMEMINISRLEPDPLLFSIPADYQIVDDKGPYAIGR